MRQHPIRSIVAVVAAAITVLAPAQLASAGDRQTTATTIQVRGGEMFLRLSAKSAKPGRVTFVFRNIGNVLHDFKINGKKTPLIQPSKSARLVVIFKRKGRYPYLCTVFGHAAAGMRGRLHGSLTVLAGCSFPQGAIRDAAEAGGGRSSRAMSLSVARRHRGD